MVDDHQVHIYNMASKWSAATKSGCHWPACTSDDRGDLSGTLEPNSRRGTTDVPSPVTFKKGCVTCQRKLGRTNLSRKASPLATSTRFPIDLCVPRLEPCSILWLHFINSRARVNLSTTHIHASDSKTHATQNARVDVPHTHRRASARSSNSSLPAK
jgi:hypothetical protein